MITGTITPKCEPVVGLVVVGGDGARRTVEAVIDTGFSAFLTLPRSWIEEFGLLWADTTTASLADNTEVVVELYACTVLWDGEELEITVHCMDGPPLVGMALLWDNLLTMELRRGGDVTLGPLG